MHDDVDAPGGTLAVDTGMNVWSGKVEDSSEMPRTKTRLLSLTT